MSRVEPPATGRDDIDRHRGSQDFPASVSEVALDAVDQDFVGRSEVGAPEFAAL